MIAPQDFFDLLSDETRLRCLVLLQKEKELCVCEFGQILDSVQPKISRHLALLRQSGLLIDERRGQWVYYRLATSLPEWIKKVLAANLTHLSHMEPYQSDLDRMQSLRKKNCCS